MGGNRTFPLASYSEPSKTIWIFEVANSTYYDLTMRMSSPVGAGLSTPGGANYDNEYGGGSPSGQGIGGYYDPSGMNTEGTVTNTDGFTKYATGLFDYTPPDNSWSFYPYPHGGRHSGGSNYLMADGHAEWLGSGSITAGFNNGAPGSAGGDDTCGKPGNPESATGLCAANTSAVNGDIQATFSVL
jgi:prepilin-type processing-associated H-X9-DG protein